MRRRIIRIVFHGSLKMGRGKVETAHIHKNRSEIIFHDGISLGDFEGVRVKSVAIFPVAYLDECHTGIGDNRRPRNRREGGTGPSPICGAASATSHTPATKSPQKEK